MAGWRYQHCRSVTCCNWLLHQTPLSTGLADGSNQGGYGSDTGGGYGGASQTTSAGPMQGSSGHGDGFDEVSTTVRSATSMTGGTLQVTANDAAKVGGEAFAGLLAVAVLAL